MLPQGGVDGPRAGAAFVPAQERDLSSIVPAGSSQREAG